MAVAFAGRFKRIHIRLFCLPVRIVLVAGLVAAASPSALAGAAGRGFRVSIKNDQPEPVIIRNCDSYCSSASINLDVQPGASMFINRTAYTKRYFAITTDSGQHLGCIDLYFNAPDRGAVVPVSAAVQCPSSGTPWVLIYVIGGVLVLGAVVFLRPGRSR